MIQIYENKIIRHKRMKLKKEKRKKKENATI